MSDIDAMTATTVPIFPRHTHDQYGIEVVDCGGTLPQMIRWKPGLAILFFVDPGEVHDGRPIQGDRVNEMGKV